jgi:hypothetical protein
VFRNRDRMVKILVWFVVLSMVLTVFATVASIFAA